MPARTLQDYIGVRTRKEVRCAEALVIACATESPRAGGAAAVYEWVLAGDSPAPFTGALHEELHDLELAVEERTALRAAHEPGRAADERDFARGAAGALAWLLGFTPLSS
ncbi:hypothetical protein [Kitasatospora cineracea]|uniref:Uncharacterized protein n=1 Tax=Kitasatospora cineracea TaxID=88074 RepID=A0A3N4RW19_9ACTN|nr:hypothetical protein [Kitasatospora cineracea]RPE37146.1 hypothetical protein EDD38_5543 [Kitasatospora cineracea]